MGETGGPKPSQKRPETTPEPAADEKPTQKPAGDAEKAKRKKEQAKEEVSKTTSDKLKEAFGGMDFVGSVKGVMESWANLWKLILSMSDEFDNFKFEQDPVKMQKILTKWEKKIKVPEIGNKESLKTSIEKPKKDEKLVDYLYRSIGLAKPDVSKIKPETKSVKLPHLIMQLKKSLTYNSGRKSITENFKKKNPIFFKGDMVVLRDKLRKGADQYNAGFVVAMSGTSVYIRNNESDKPKKYPAAQLFVAFHIPGNNQNGKVPEYPGQKVKKKKKG